MSDPRNSRKPTDRTISDTRETVNYCLNSHQPPGISGISGRPGEGLVWPGSPTDVPSV
jgi:hypothetical protein